MERILKELFDFQYIAKNERLASLISATRARYHGNALSDGDLDWVNAAGDFVNLPDKGKNYGGKD